MWLQLNIKMKRKLLTIGSLAFLQLFAKAQNKDTIATVNKTQIDIVYNQYIQDGNNSAITGGIGTERLTVYGPSITGKKTWKNNSFKLNTGVDIISSASTDKIDFVMSSASILDQRVYANTVYEHTFKKTGLSVFGGIGISFESDYLSIGSKIGLTKEDRKNLAQYSAEFQMFNDDLRWGRKLGEWKEFKLIYPAELRTQQWYDTYRRNSYNLKLGYSKVLNKKAIFGIFPIFSYQYGLLATPFHRVYFTDGTVAVEQLPKNRTKLSIGLNYNQFLGSQLILKNSINPYIDNWGILALAVENETAIKLNPVYTILSNLRVYTQRSSDYFAPYKEHEVDKEFYTSDYDLSNYQTYGAGCGLKFSPYSKYGKRSQFNTLILRYNYMHRTNGLNAHIMSLNIQIEKDSKTAKRHNK